MTDTKKEMKKQLKMEGLKMKKESLQRKQNGNLRKRNFMHVELLMIPARFRDNMALQNDER